VAENKTVTNAREVERFHTEVIARAKETSRTFVPNGKRKVADEMIDAVLTKPLICVEDLFLVDALAVAVNPRVGYYVNVLNTVRLLIEPDVCVAPHQIAIYRRAVNIND